MVPVKADGDAVLDDARGSLLEAGVVSAGGANDMRCTWLLLLVAAVVVVLLTAGGAAAAAAGSFLLVRVAAVALNIVGLGAGSLKLPGLAAVRVAACCLRHASSCARRSLSALACDCCAATTAARSALCTPCRPR
jgi:hypothetical protein